MAPKILLVLGFVASAWACTAKPGINQGCEGSCLSGETCTFYHAIGGGGCGCAPSFAAQSKNTQDTKVLATFPGSIKWIENNDPIMGGASHGNWSVADSSGVFQGTVKNVSFLHAPGFCRAMTISPFLKDVSAYLGGGLIITVRTTTPDYKGWKFSFGSLGTPKHHGGHEIEGSFKTKFSVPPSQNNEWQSVFLKFDDFSYDWSDYTGECSTKDPDGYQHKCCTKDTADVCPTAKRLSGVNSFNIWAEGAEGDFRLELKEVAVTASPTVLV